jgi:hypothetical protein
MQDFAILGIMSGRAISLLILLAALANAACARADEIRLKDGTKISGTIVGFENDSFRVETSYGFALIQKDKVADINISAPKKEPEPKAKSNTPATPPPATKPAASPAVATESTSATNPPAVVNALASERPPVASGAFPAPVKNVPMPAKTIAPPAPPATPAPPAPPPPPPAPPEPPVIRDEIHGNLYVNHTYGFQMYKPPSWDMIPSARKALPDAVAALGTYDQTTMLVIGRARAKDSLDVYAAAIGKALSGVYENYRLISTSHPTIAGLPAVEQRSRGTADGRDWSVVLLTLMHGNDAFTLLGMTWADSDLIQVQENVISKTLNSLTFVTQ